ncbi:putative F-box/LRR-repeat protein C02F5.7 [Portunus trituberculatus]|uniref:Putative F-box/LRR-repeat protein C02F5.7 n=1 Tax=Portunus trituberculatus TaxID=210409 RepID=A0A5B7H1A2_PORTR|nr:putative F-box/LRR-repeat protein C02F5.7 [Portunus trituberculatus]
MLSDDGSGAAVVDSNGTGTPCDASHSQERSCSSSCSENKSDAEAPQAQCHVHCVPREILLYIFSFLSVKELGRSVEPVCVAWRDLARDPTLRTCLIFSFQNHVHGDRIKSLLAGSPLLTTLELQSREDAQDLLLHAASFCPRLKDLTVKFSDGLTEVVFRALMENCSRMQSLNVEGSRVCDRESFILMAGFLHLRHLNLSHCDLLDDVGLITIAKQCRSLEYLDIDGITNIHDNSVIFLNESLSHSLKFLFLDGEKLTNASYQSLRTCTQLLKLGVSFCEKMTDKGLFGIICLRNLTSLKLRKGCQLTPAGLKTLFENGRLPYLAHVNLGECSLLDDSVLEAMAECCPQLLHLALHWCWEVTDVGVSAIIARCPRLRVLDLVGVVQLTGTVFDSVPTSLPDLLILDLEQCNEVDDVLLQVVVSQMPSLRVFNYWGDLVVLSESSDESDTSESGTIQVEGSGRTVPRLSTVPQQGSLRG